MATELTPDFINKLLAGKAVHPQYKLATEKSDEMLLHTEGKNIEAHIKAYRPSEDKPTTDHRIANFRKITQSHFSKVVTCLSKINRSDNFTISFPDETALAKTIKEYFTKDYPEYDSFRNWFFTEGMEFFLTEPNGWLSTEPAEWVWEPTQSPQPIAVIYRADQVKNWEDENYFFVLLDETVKLPKDSADAKTGLVYKLITGMGFVRYEQVKDNPNEADSFKRIELWMHNWDDLPAFRMGGFPANSKNRKIYKSYVSGVLPYWDEALIQASDKQASMKQHMFPQAAIFGATECSHCQGSGRTKGAGIGNRSWETCYKCQGKKRIVSPYADIVVSDNKDNQHPLPEWAPMKYITKDIEPVKFTKGDISDNIYDGFSALNMEFLADTPLNQSGKAKEVDREELNAFVFKIADHIVCNILRPFYYYGIRFFALKLPEETLNDFQPKISIPKHFDIVTAEVYQAEVASAKNAKIDSRIVGGMEMKFAKKQFEYEPELLAIIELSYDLDPFPGVSQDDKFTMISNGGISKASYIISCNALDFVKRALQENDKFADLERTKQIEKLTEYAAEIDPSIASDNTVAMMPEIMAIQQNYFAGLISLEGAISALTIVGKLTPADAQAMLNGSVPAKVVPPGPIPPNPNPPIA